MPRSQNDNKELGLSVRRNGRIVAAFRHYHLAEEFAYQHKIDWPDSTVEIIREAIKGVTDKETMLSLGPVQK